MSTEQHEALKLAGELDWTGDTAAGDTIRTQHALIVQMAKALASLYSVAPSKAPGAGLIVGAEAKHSAALDSSRAAIAATTQYLKGPMT